MEKFSQELIEDFIVYWLQRWEKEISAETAETYLNALAELYLCVREIEKNKQ